MILQIDRTTAFQIRVKLGPMDGKIRKICDTRDAHAECISTTK